MPESVPSEVRHAILAIYHRWFLIFERPKTDAIVDRQLEILAPDVTPTWATIRLG